MIATRGQGVALVVLRTLLGWHFLYEGYYKLVLPAWSPAGAPLAAWSPTGTPSFHVPAAFQAFTFG